MWWIFAVHIKGQNAGAWYGQISESRRATTEEALAVRRVPLSSRPPLEPRPAAPQAAACTRQISHSYIYTASMIETVKISSSFVRVPLPKEVENRL